MKKKTITFRQLETAMKQTYGKDACLDIVEPVIIMPLTQSIEDVKGFDNKLALILHKSKPTYCPMDDTKDMVKKAKKDGSIVVPIPVKEAPFLYADGTQRNFNRICLKYDGFPFIIPQIDIPSIYDAEIPRARLEKNGAKNIVKHIDNAGKGM